MHKELEVVGTDRHRELRKMIDSPTGKGKIIPKKRISVQKL